MGNYDTLNRRWATPILIDHLLAHPPAERAYDVTSAAYGADPTGVVLSTAAFQAANNAAVAAGGGTVYVPRGTYLIDGTYLAVGGFFGGVRVGSNVTFYFEAGVVLQQIGVATTGYSMFRFDNVENILIEGNGLVVRGDRSTHIGTTGEQGHALAVFDNVKNLTLRNITIKDTWGDALYVTPAIAVGNGEIATAVGRAARPRNITLVNVSTANCRRQGFSICGAVGVKGIGGTISATNGIAPGSGMDLEPDHRNIENEDISFFGTRIELCEGQALTIARTKSAMFTGCYFGVDADESVTTSTTRTAMNVEESISTDSIVFVGCRFAGPIREPGYCRFVGCDVSFNLTANAAIYAVAHDTDSPSFWYGCTFRVSGYARLLFIAGSLSRATRKEFIDCRFLHVGNTLADQQAHSSLSGYALLHDCNLLQEGSGPVTGYALGTSGANVIFRDVWVDTLLAYGFFSGRVTIDPERGDLMYGSVGRSTETERGDTSTTLAAGFDHPVQVWNVPLSTTRTATLADSATNGVRFRIVRSASATGASPLTVSANAGALMKNLAVGEWVELVCNGSAWRIVAAGAGA